MKPLIIFGAGGYCKDVLSIIHDQGKYLPAAVVDPRMYSQGYRSILRIPIIPAVAVPVDPASEVIVVLGDPQQRALKVSAVEKFFNDRTPWARIIHPDATIGIDVKIGIGTIIAAGTRIMSDTNIGQFCVLNLNSIVGHDCNVGDFCTLAPSCNVLGHVFLGEFCDIGTGAVILPRMTIATDVRVGANAVITKNIGDPGTTWVGVPARKIDKTTQEPK